jgi:hypothetical protein
MNALAIIVVWLLGLRGRALTVATSPLACRTPTDFTTTFCSLNLYRCSPHPIQAILSRVHLEHEGFDWSHFHSVSHELLLWKVSRTFFFCWRQASQPRPFGTPGMVCARFYQKQRDIFSQFESRCLKPVAIIRMQGDKVREPSK